MVKVSVIIPVYQVSLDYLRMCFDSLVAQTMQESEFIIVSDGAPEAERSICEEYARKDTRFRFFMREHAGVSASRNYGIEQAKGAFVTFVDADDWINQDALESLYQCADEWDSDIINTNYITYRNNAPQKMLWSKSPNKQLNGNEIKIVIDEFISLKEDSIPRGVCAKLYKKTFLDDSGVRFNEKIKIQEDTLFNLTCFSKTQKISYLNKLFYHYRENLESATRRYRKDYFDIYLQAMLEIEKQSNPQQKKVIGKEIALHFFESWDSCYMNPQNTDSFSTRMKTISCIIRSNDFQYLISEIDSKNMSVLIRFELFLFKKKITIPIWLHGLKKLIV